jgi:predicted kinase
MPVPSRLQIHVAGAKRSGKTTLATALAEALSKTEGGAYKPKVLDVDRVRIELFGGMHGAPDSEESKKEHAETMAQIYTSLLPQAIDAGFTPIVVAGHSHQKWLGEAEKISAEKHTKLTFLILRAPTIEEAARRAAAAPEENQTDMQDFNDPMVRASFERSVTQVEDSYRNTTNPQVHWIEQDTVDKKAERALAFVLG